MITKEQLKDEIDTVEDAQTLELVYQLLLKIKQGVTPNKPTIEREMELEAALQESKADIAAGRYVKESPEEHLARLESME
jgi:hypothetical protein